MENSRKPPVCLSIAGLDPSGGAGILADIKAFKAFECFGAAAVTSITYQNTQGVFGARNTSAVAVRNQIEAVFDDYEVAAVKSGMLPTKTVIETVAKIIADRKPQYFVLDPVVRSTSGFDLIDDGALSVMMDKLFELATIITPNITEAERITRVRINGDKEIELAAKRLWSLGSQFVLVKGGHMTGNKALDYLFDGKDFEIFESSRIETTSTHGTGCILSASIAANLAKGKTVSESVRISKAFVHDAIRTSPGLGKGNSPINI